MKCNVDVVRIRENSIQLNGWAIGKTPETEITYQVRTMGHISRSGFSIVATRRDDVSQIYYGRTGHDRELGFDIQFPYERGKDYYLIANGEGRKIRMKYNEELIRKAQQRGAQADAEDPRSDEHGDGAGLPGFLERRMV